MPYKAAYSGPLRPGESRQYLIRTRRRKTSSAVGSGAAPSNYTAGYSKITGSAFNRSNYNTAVGKALARPKKQAKSKVGRNQKAIIAVAKQVRKLQLERYGFIQSQYQYAVHAPLTNFVPTLGKSTLFMVNDFYVNSPIWSGGIVAQQSVFTETGAFTKPTTDPDLDSRWLFNLRNQEDTVSKVQYLPERSRIGLKWSVERMEETMPPLSLRVTVFKFRKMPPQTTARNYLLPQALGAYGDMCNLYNPGNREHFNYRLHNVMYDKYVTITPTALKTKQIKNLQIDVQLPLKQMRPDITTDPSGQSTWTNTDVDTQVFCLISSSFDPNDQSYAGLNQRMELTKFNVWRDSHGITTM